MNFAADSFNQNNSSEKKSEQPDILGFMTVQNQDFIHSKSNDDGLNRMLASLQHMTSSLQSNQALQASALVGRNALVQSNTFELAAEGDIMIAVDLPENVHNVSASIYTEWGELMASIPLDHAQPGFFQFTWDGTGACNQRLQEASYQVKVHSSHSGSLKTMIFANIDSVSLDQNEAGLKLNVAGIGTISIDQVRHIKVERT